jgi:hypothetical protein
MLIMEFAKFTANQKLREFIKNNPQMDIEKYRKVKNSLNVTVKAIEKTLKRETYIVTKQVEDCIHNIIDFSVDKFVKLK